VIAADGGNDTGGFAVLNDIGTPREF